MPCIIRDKLVTLDSGTAVPHAGLVLAAPTSLEHFSSVDDEWIGENFTPRQASADTTTGEWQHVLPWQSESDPDTQTWVITLPRGVMWTGVVPEGVAGPLTIHDLVTTYGWALASTDESVRLYVGAPGTDGVTGIIVQELSVANEAPDGSYPTPNTTYLTYLSTLITIGTYSMIRAMGQVLAIMPDANQTLAIRVAVNAVAPYADGVNDVEIGVSASATTQNFALTLPIFTQAVAFAAGTYKVKLMIKTGDGTSGITLPTPNRSSLIVSEVKT